MDMERDVDVSITWFWFDPEQYLKIIRFNLLFDQIFRHDK